MFAFFERLINPFPPQYPQQPPKALVAFCLHYTQGVMPLLIIMAFLTACIAIMEVTLFGFLGELVDWLSNKQPETLFQEEGLTLAFMAAIVLLGLPIAVLLHASVIHQALLGNFPMRIRWQAHRYLLGQSLAFYQNEFAGRIATKVMQTALSVRETVMKLLDVLLFISIYFIGMTLVVSSSDYRLSLPLLCWLIGYGSALYYFIPKLRLISSKQADARSSMVGAVVDSYSNIQTVKLFSHSKREADYAQESMSQFLDTVHPQMRLATQLNVSVWILNVLLLFTISSLSIWLWTQQAISTGSIAVAIALSLRLNGMSQWIMWEVSSLFENIGSVQDGISTLSKAREVLDETSAKEISSVKGHIKFNDVSFAYSTNHPVFQKLSFDIKPGEKIGLVGRSGAGKSTLVNLLLRFHDIQNGSIILDGQNIAQLKQESLRAEIGMVTQDTALLHRSVRENILYGKPDATDEDMISAAKQAEAHEFILGLTDSHGNAGYDAQVGERGVKLSGGQRQRIAIARVLLKDAPILILDEATSALDSEVEAAIQASLIVLDEGKIIEQGSHAEL